MAVLTQHQILKRIANGSIGFIPNLDSFQLQAHSVDLRLGFTFLVPKTWHITENGREVLDITDFDKPRPEYFDVIELEQGQHFDLLPQEYVLVSTLESVKVGNDLMAVLYPRSSTNRKGLSVDLTGIIDSGYEGQLTIPLRNNTKSQTVRLYPGERLCQIVFEELSEPVNARKSKYHKKDIIEGFKREKKSESSLIRSGDIKKLKKEYGIAETSD
jgi:dCTP deaminase